MGNVPGAKEIGARARLYDLIAHVESHLAFEDIEAFVLLVMDVQHTPVAIRSEYLYYGVPFAGLLLRGLDGSQHPQPPPRLSFARLMGEGPACGIFLCVEHDPRPSLLFCSRHSASLLSLHSSVQRTMPENEPAVKVQYTSMCNNFFYATKIRDEAQSTAHAADPPTDHRSGHRAAPDGGPGAGHREAVAEKAGVQRYTYYAHFPELKDLYQACTAHYLERNPLPEPSRWEEISGPEERLREALKEVYAYYQGNEAMLTNVLRDMPFDPILQENNVLLFRHWESMRETIADAFEASGERRETLLGAIALALELQTWRTLVRQQGLERVMNSIRNGLGMRETEIAREPS